MEHLYKAYDMLDRELEELTRQGDLKNGATVEMIDELAHGMKSLKTIIAMCESEEGQSGDYYPMYHGSYAQRRNARGQYSRGSYRGGRGGNSRDDGMEQIVKKIDELKQSVDRMG
ncbi:MAG: hypothetical protein IJP92_00910 [Lachnospiraceae bacterium]|nr:hypothetical protein [Lachnospiraceae bacterium]